MPLFICSECGCVENSHLVNKSETYIPTVYNYVGDESKFFPQMSLMEMQGFDKQDIIVNGVVWKRKNEIKMLCSECNNINGWHNEFTKTQPTELDKEIALYSKYNMITPFDHESGALIKCDDTISEYQVWDKYRALHYAFRDLFKTKYTDHISDFKKNFFPLMYKILMEDRMNFEVHGTYERTNWNDEYDVLLHLRDAMTYENESKSQTFNALMYKHGYNKNITGVDIIDAVLNPYFFSKIDSKPHWKESQPIEEKNEKLRKAEEKRLRKQQRR